MYSSFILYFNEQINVFVTWYILVTLDLHCTCNIENSSGTLLHHCYWDWDPVTYNDVVYGSVSKIHHSNMVLAAGYTTIALAKTKLGVYDIAIIMKEIILRDIESI